MKFQAYHSSGYVLGPCEKCSKEERGLVQYEDGRAGVECLECGHHVVAESIEWLDEVPDEEQ